MKECLSPFSVLPPVPVVMVSYGDKNNSNITTVAWTGIISSEPPMVYISLRPQRNSYGIIKEKMEFVINIPNADLVYQADYCGTKSGRDENKFNTANLTMEECSKISTYLIKECPVNLECKVKEIKDCGSHHMFIAEIVCANVDTELLDENGKFDYLKSNLLCYLGNNYVVANNKVAERGICLK